MGSCPIRLVVSSLVLTKTVAASRGSNRPCPHALCARVWTTYRRRRQVLAQSLHLQTTRCLFW